MRVPLKKRLLIELSVLGFCLLAARVALADCVSTSDGSGGTAIACTGYTPGVENGTSGNDTITNDGQPSSTLGSLGMASRMMLPMTLMTVYGAARAMTPSLTTAP